MTGLVCSLRDGDAMTSPRPCASARGEHSSQPGAGVPEFPRKLPKTYEYLQLRRAGNTLRFSRGSSLGGCPESCDNFGAPPAGDYLYKGSSGACLFFCSSHGIFPAYWTSSVFLYFIVKWSITARSAGRASLPGP